MLEGHVHPILHKGRVQLVHIVVALTALGALPLPTLVLGRDGADVAREIKPRRMHDVLERVRDLVDVARVQRIVPEDVHERLSRRREARGPTRRGLEARDKAAQLVRDVHFAFTAVEALEGFADLHVQRASDLLDEL